MYLRYFLMAANLFLLSNTIFASDTITYKNQRGSTLTLQFAEDNTISGTFTTAVASKDCPQAIGMKRPLTGYMAKNAIGFSVNYPECGSIVTFAGNVENNKALIDTIALIVHNTKQISKEGPGARMISYDVFKQV